LEFVVGLNRTFAFPNPQPSGASTLKPDINGSMNRELTNMGMSLYRMPAPTGYPEVGKKWISSAQLKARIYYQNNLFLNRNSQMLTWVIEQGLSNEEEIVDYLLSLMLANDYQPEERAIALNILTDNG